MTMRSLPWGLSALALGAASPVWSQTWPDHGWMFHRDWGWGFGGGFGMIVFWALIVLLIVLAVRGFRGGSDRTVSVPPANSALQVLQERFARGEIDKTEYEERRKVLAS
jgi:putative membrane protein